MEFWFGVQEMEEREKVVNHMWDVYTNSRRIRLPRFWQEAFEAAYEELISDVPEVRDAAITEIAKMSVRSIDFDPHPIQSTVGFSSYSSCFWSVLSILFRVSLAFCLWNFDFVVWTWGTSLSFSLIVIGLGNDLQLIPVELLGFVFIVCRGAQDSWYYTIINRKECASSVF